MKRVLAILLLVPFIMVLAPPCHAAGNGEVAVSFVDVPAELQKRSVLVTLGSGPNDTDAVLVTRLEPVWPDCDVAGGHLLLQCRCAIRRPKRLATARG